MESFMVAGVIAVVYFLIKFIEMRFLSKENKPLKKLIQDTLMVYISSVVGLLLIQQLNLTKEENKIISTNAFTDKPDF